MAPYRVDKRQSGRHPFELFTLYLAILVGIPTVLGLTPRPGSINESMPTWAAFGWSLVITVGSLLAVVGIYLPSRALGLVLEQLGLGFVGLTSLLYVAAAIYALGWNGAVLPVAMVGAFGASCLWRYAQLQSILNGVRADKNRRDES